MNPILRNILAVVAGVVIGGLVNMGLITLGPSIIPPPQGIDPTDMESLAANVHLLQPKHFIFPFLAHALGTLFGALIAAKIAVSHQMKFALGIGAFFLVGGIMAVKMIPGPTWFAAVDLLAAYIPMGWLGGTLAGARLNNSEK